MSPMTTLSRSKRRERREPHTDDVSLGDEEAPTLFSLRPFFFFQTFQHAREKKKALV